MTKPLSIDILIPTRDRPADMERVAHSIGESAANPKKIALCFYIDQDDKESQAQREKLREYLDQTFREALFCIGPRVNLPQAYNEMAAWCKGDIIMYAADDLSFDTKGWDSAVRRAFGRVPDRILLAHCYDPARGTSPFPDHGFISRWSKSVLKYVFPVFPPHPKVKNGLGAAFTDIWLHALYVDLKRLKYLPKVQISHRHWALREGADKAPDVELDDNYVRHAIMSRWCKTEEFTLRLAEMPDHVEILKKWQRWVEGGGLKRAAEQGWLQ